MERGEGLLADGFDGDRMNLVVPRRLEQGFRVRAVGLAAADVAVHIVRGE